MACDFRCHAFQAVGRCRKIDSWTYREISFGALAGSQILGKQGLLRSRKLSIMMTTDNPERRAATAEPFLPMRGGEGRGEKKQYPSIHGNGTIFCDRGAQGRRRGNVGGELTGLTQLTQGEVGSKF